MPAKRYQIAVFRLILSVRLSKCLIIRQYIAGAPGFEKEYSTSRLWFVREGKAAMERVESDGDLTPACG